MTGNPLADALLKAHGWTATAERRPDRDTRVDWLSPSGELVKGGTFAGVWLLPGGGMYVYYEPCAWRPAKEGGR